MLGIRMVDNGAEFAKWIIRYDTIVELERVFPKLNIEAPGEIYCYNERNRDAIIAMLDGYSIAHTVETMVWDQSLIDKATGKKFNNKDEIQNLLINGIIPESERLPELERDNKVLKEELKQSKQKQKESDDALLTIMFGGDPFV